jgi:hypothetical protein
MHAVNLAESGCEISSSNPWGQPAKRLQIYLRPIHTAASQYCHPLQDFPLTHKKSKSGVLRQSTYYLKKFREPLVTEFLLIIAFKLERDGFAELEMGSSVQSQNF